MRKPIIKSIYICTTLLFICLCGCPKKRVIEKKRRYLQKVSIIDFITKEDMGKQSMITALDKQIKLFKHIIYKKAGDKKWAFDDKKFSTHEMLAAVEKFKEIYTSSKSLAELQKSLKKYFVLYRFSGLDGKKVLVTGYYTPVLEASRKKTKRFRYPLYKAPSDLLKIDLAQFDIGVKGVLMGRADMKHKLIKPYYNREEIDWNSVLQGKKLEIAYLENYMDQFFMHIQGGGILRVYNSRTKRKEKIYLNYAGKNGRSYFSVGRALINNKKVSKKKMSLQAIRDYFYKNPSELRQYAVQNKSYVFYSEGDSGPYGSIGVTVTPGRSIATDKKIFSGGGIAFISGKYRANSQKKFNRFVIDQDTGGAIKKNHIDLYCGEGQKAEEVAGYMKEGGDVFFLLPQKPMFH